MILSPDPYRRTTPINPGLINCGTSSEGGVECIGETILNDGDLGPEQPDITNRGHNNRYIVWTKASRIPLMALEVSLSRISAIDIYLLNWPAEAFGVPNFQLYQTSQLRLDTSTDGGRTVEQVNFDFLNNDQLSQFDRIIRVVTLRPREPIASAGYLLTWTFSNLDRIDHFAISEIIFREDEADFTPGAVVFRIPASEEPMNLQPSAKIIRSGPLLLTCSVASEGSFSWRWRENSKDIIPSNAKLIVYSDATRTSILTFNSITFDDAGIYSCEAGFTFPGTSPATRRYNVHFPSEWYRYTGVC